MILISTEIKIEYRILFHPMDLFSNNCSFHFELIFHLWITKFAKSEATFASRLSCIASCVFIIEKKKKNIYK